MISRLWLLITMYLADLGKKLAFKTPKQPTGNSFECPDTRTPVWFDGQVPVTGNVRTSMSGTVCLIDVR